MTDPFGLSGAGQQPTLSAAEIVAGRVFLLDNAQYVPQVPPYLDAVRSGLALVGQTRGRTLDKLSHQMTCPGLLDPADYNELATEHAPFAMPDDTDTLFDTSLDMVLNGQRDHHASAVITPSRYVAAGDSRALKALMREADALERIDVIVAVPVALSWLVDQQFLPQLIAVLNKIRQPKAIMFGEGKDPFRTAKAVANFRLLLGETTGVGLWRADLPAAFDCIAYGGAFAAIGAGGSMRHLIPADEKAMSSNASRHTPAVLLPQLLKYVRGAIIATRYANAPAPSCSCQVCDGRSLDRFDSLDPTVRAEAHDHNAVTWMSWLPDLLEHTSAAARQAWWRERCRAAVYAIEAENVRIRQKGAFEVGAALKKMAAEPTS